MKTGMMWSVHKNETMFNSLYRAIDYYKEKYGIDPNLAYINPKHYDEMVLDIQHSEQFPLDLKSDRYILPRSIWIGVRNS